LNLLSKQNRLRGKEVGRPRAKKRERNHKVGKRVNSSGNSGKRGETKAKGGISPASEGEKKNHGVRTFRVSGTKLSVPKGGVRKKENLVFRDSDTRKGNLSHR